MEEALIARLLAEASISAVFGDRIHWSVAPEGSTMPFLVVSIAAGGQDYTHSGRNAFSMTRTQLDSYSTDALEAIQGSRVVLSELETVETIEGVLFEDAWAVADDDMPAEPLEDGTQVFRRKLEVMIPHRPA